MLRTVAFPQARYLAGIVALGTFVALLVVVY